jgi:hypothetical protein
MGGVADLFLDAGEIAAAVAAIVAWVRVRRVDIHVERKANGHLTIKIVRMPRRDARESSGG